MNVSLDWIGREFPSFTQPQLLAKGGQKTVFSGVHEKHGVCVLKIINSSQDIEQIEREIAAVRSLKSKRVPTILEYGTAQSNLGDCVWIFEQMIGAPSLRALLSHNRMSVSAVRDMALHVLEVLVLAEQKGIVHRDIKPENIIGDCGNYYVIDFGISRHIELQSLTQTALAYGKGTLGYSPIEQIRNNKGEIDARADLFALGVTMYECLSGINPFTHAARDGLEVLRRMDSMELPIHSLIQNTDLADFIATATQRRRDRRPPNAAFAFKWLAETSNNTKK